ncbi:hypothetical protein GCM10008995_10330 [Halobellus salinus]|uniref:Uncharacterized protein n=1 Tax=Halobellus salinus TaxID=931585 RepID=A0A830ENP8_9EURY|nr:hypothetical protein [Halobellus salinus]GGJ02482.1 hypothetical protein GCM10008995_10330 [Halobellus salinus]SMP16979.1 hypothetical protein SAMN06265347_10644 [Halobellus salinus]
MRALAPAVALLVVLSGVAVADPAPLAAGPATPDNTWGADTAAAATPTQPAVTTPGAPAQANADPQTGAAELPLNVLAIPSGASTRSSLELESVELGSGLAFESTTTGLRVSTGTALERIDSAESDERRQQLLLQEVSAIEQRVISLRARQRQVVDAYARAELPPRRLLYELAEIDAEARELEDRRERIQSVVESTPGFSIPSSRFGNIELELNTLTGPVRGHAAAVLTGEADSARFFVQTGPESVALGILRDGTYVREVYREPLRGGDNGEFTLADAVNVTEGAYPTIAAERLRDDTLGNPGSDSTRVTIEHRRGRLVAFVDSGSQRVFKEFQFRPLDQVMTPNSVSATRDGLELTAHRTYPGGPTRLRLNSTDDAEPVDAQITVGPPGGRSAVVGRTGGDGSLWTVAPTGTYQVTAIDGSSVVVLSVDPTRTPSVYGATDNSTGDRTDTAGTTTPTATPAG